jgi:hypothetical protein
MKHRIVALVLCATLPAALRAEPFEQAEVTRTVNLVSLLREMESAQAAAVGDVIKGQTALKTGGDSRAELEFPDETITRVGSNALFRFYAGARNMTLDGGTMLFSSPKGIGGGTVEAGAITAAASGTDFLISYVKGLATKGGKVQVICLSERVVVYFTADPSLRRLLRPGEMLDIPNGAKDFPPLSTVSLSQILSTHVLFESGGFRPLYSQALLEQIAANQQNVKSPSAISGDEQALRLALADLNSPDLDASVVVEAVGYIANSPVSVETVMEEVSRILAKDKDALLAVITEVAKASPSLAISIVRGSTKGAPSLAPEIAATVAALFPKLAIAISYAAAEVAPGEARAIALAVAAVVPDQRDLIFAAVRSASDRGLNFGALGFGMGQSINSANFGGATPPAAATPAEISVSPGPTPAPSPPPIVVISPES